jgi:hypothetical protein
MESAHEYLKRAADCERLAEDASTESIRNMLLTAAKYWRRMASAKATSEATLAKKAPSI